MQSQQTVQVDGDALLALTQESLEHPSSVKKLEGSATELYKALLAGRDRGKCNRVIHRTANLTNTPDMAATMERLDEYKKYNAQFCKRILDYLSIMFTAQVYAFQL